MSPLLLHIIRVSFWGGAIEIKRDFCVVITMTYALPFDDTLLHSDTVCIVSWGLFVPSDTHQQLFWFASLLKYVKDV